MPEQELDIVQRGEHVLIPNGEYIVKHIDTSSSLYKGQQHKKVVTFEVVSGEHKGKKVSRYYNVQSDKDGRVSGGLKSDLVRDILRVDENALSRQDRLPMNVFKNKYLRIRTRQVNRDHKRDNIPQPIRYSIVDAILGVESGLTVVDDNFNDDDLPF